MANSENTKRVVVHVSRGLAYLTFPVGAFLLGLFILSALSDDLDFTTTENILLNILAILLFFIPAIVILFLHPSLKHSNANIRPNTDQALTAKIKRYAPHFLIIVILAAIGLVSLFLSVIFMGAVFGG